VLQRVGLERSLVIDLQNTGNIFTRDDRPFKGSSVSSFKSTEKGLEFSCHIKSKYKWPYCELVFDVRPDKVADKLLGYDFSQFDKVGLWIEHNHKTQPGTRFELHNFNPTYSNYDVVNSLKYNTIEFSENNVPHPTWIKLHSFYVPTWWNATHDLSLENGGTDFSNIHTIAITTGGLINDGHYQLTVERIEFRGKYIKTETLLMALMMLWSLAAGYLFHRFSFANSKLEATTKQKNEWENKATNDPLTGALNRLGLRKLIDRYDLQNRPILSVIFIDIDHFKDVNDTFGHNIGDCILQKFAENIKSNCRHEDTLVRWGGEEFLLVCPDINISQGKNIAEHIRTAIQGYVWPKNINLTCSLGVAQKGDEGFDKLIARADKALYKAKENGRNRSVTA
jgi:diguanylate cyclase (GGDEF)-like protein